MKLPWHCRFKTLASSIPAAALMLGVSQAATVGFNFQSTGLGCYCADCCPDVWWNGTPVTGPAFGMAANAWETLAPMPNCPGPYDTLDEVVDSKNTQSWLHPLPNGSLHVTWSAASAGTSVFGGYHAGQPQYIFPYGSPQPGEEEVYSGFLQDGTGTSYYSGINPAGPAPGYLVDIVGLKSLFTNSPFVVELIASSDLLQNLTNAFIIDASAQTTQSVSYPNILSVANVGGGGLSTVSGPLLTDHLKIVGNQAQYSPGPPSVYTASTLSGFILTDQPVVTMSPQPVLAAMGNTVLLRAIAIGVPPLAYQWRRGGAPISGATNPNYGLTNISASGDFDLVVTNLYGSATSRVATVAVVPNRLTITPGPSFVLDSKPAEPPNDGENFGATWLDSSEDAVGNIRVGVMQFAAAESAQIVVPTATTTNFDSASGTITFWMRSVGTTTNTGSKGEMLFDRLNNGLGLDLVQTDHGTVLVHSPAGDFKSGRVVSDAKWHHISLVWGLEVWGTTAECGIPQSLYVDGILDNFGAYFGGWSSGQPIELGRSHDSQWQPYNGFLSDFRIYSRALSNAEIATLAGTDALVDPNTLQVRLNFEAPPVPGITVTSPPGGAVLQSATVVSGPYTNVPSVGSKYSAAAQNGQQFYRFSCPGPAPIVINSNPFDM
jgi:hypothetical protein